MKILAGIVTFNPNISVLKENIKAVLSQVDAVVLVDNHSGNYSDIDSLKTCFNFLIIKNDENEGIAHALNQLCQYAENADYDWVLTLDQDSIVPNGLISEYKKYVGLKDVGMICCRFSDRNIDALPTDEHFADFDFVPVAITSGSMMEITKWRKVGGFSEELFIDCVDNDICYSLCENGYNIIRVNRVVMSHTIGKSKSVLFKGNQIIVYGESAIRCYYIFRNNILVAKKHWKFIRRFYRFGIISFIHSIIRRIIIINRFEEDLKNKNMMIRKGLWHGIVGKYGKLEQ